MNAPTCDQAGNSGPTGGWFLEEGYPQPVDCFGRKEIAFGRPPDMILAQSRFWVGNEIAAIYGGLKSEQLSDFSTIRAVYPQILGSYPQFGGLVV